MAVRHDTGFSRGPVQAQPILQARLPNFPPLNRRPRSTGPSARPCVGAA